MSRKRSKKVVDTGGLDLSINTTNVNPEFEGKSLEEQMALINAGVAKENSEQAATIAALPVELPAEGAVQPAADNFARSEQNPIGSAWAKDGEAPAGVTVEVKRGMNLYEALIASEFLHLAAHSTSNPEVVIVANNYRYWSAVRSTLEPILFEYHYDDKNERTRTDWRPVFGTESGLYIG